VVEKVECLFHAHGRHRLVVPGGLVLIDVDGFEHEHLPVEMQQLAGGVPVRRSDLTFFYQEAPAFIQPAEDPPSEFDIFDERAVHLGQAPGGLIHRKLPLHSGEDLELASGWHIPGPGSELQGGERMPILRRQRVDVGEVEGLGNRGNQLACARVVVLVLLQFAPHRGRVGRLAKPLLFGGLLFGGERLLVDQDHAAHHAAGCFHQVLHLRAAWRAALALLPGVQVRLIVVLQLVFDCGAHQFERRSALCAGLFGNCRNGTQGKHNARPCLSWACLNAQELHSARFGQIGDERRYPADHISFKHRH